MPPIATDKPLRSGRWYFVPFLHTKHLQFSQVSWLLCGDRLLQINPYIFNDVKVWGLEWPFQNIVLVLLH